MTTYVLVHGAWHGGWCWRSVAESLRDAGHDVYTPTLDGLSERFHARPTGIGLATHVRDVVSTLDSHNLAEVVLVGHSYAGMVVCGAAAAAPGRLSRLVVVDGFLPERGEAAIELLPPHAAAHYRESASSAGDGWSIPPRPLANLGVTDQSVVDRVAPLLTPHPLQTYLDSAAFATSEVRVPGSYLLCVGWNSPFVASAERAARLGWSVDRIDADHEVMLTRPGLLADNLLPRQLGLEEAVSR